MTVPVHDIWAASEATAGFGRKGQALTPERTCSHEFWVVRSGHPLCKHSQELFRIFTKDGHGWGYLITYHSYIIWNCTTTKWCGYHLPCTEYFYYSGSKNLGLGSLQLQRHKTHVPGKNPVHQTVTRQPIPSLQPKNSWVFSCIETQY